jgi:SAM-dependent methyltransferase
METSLLTEHNDPMGRAIADYFVKGKAAKLRVFSSQFDEDEIPVNHLFRTFNEMSSLEQKALELAKGKILDCGAGSGCHALELQQMGKEVDAIDISPLSVEVMLKRGVESAFQTDLFNLAAVQEYDTVLMLMNGSGIIGKLENMEKFFMKMKQILRPGGVVYMDSSDLKYLFEDEDGSYVINLAGDYYGEVDFRMQYKQVKGNTFDWLYIDFQTLSLYASKFGFKAELVEEGKHYDYLAALRML